MTNPATERYATVAGIRADLEWLYNAWQHIRDDPAYTAMNPDPVITERLDKFHMRMESCLRSDTALRLLYGYSGCIFKPKRCPESGPMVCGGCAVEGGKENDNDHRNGTGRHPQRAPQA